MKKAPSRELFFSPSHRENVKKCVQCFDTGALRLKEIHSRGKCEHALAHSLPDTEEVAYRRGDLQDERAPLMHA
jgi:hypothetical protein